MTSKAIRVTPASAAKPTTVAEYVAQQIVLCGKSQLDIAKEAGFDSPNVITMIKQGRTKVPLKKIGSMAKALEVDPIFFMKMCLNEYTPGLMDTISQIMNQPIVTQNEMEFVKIIRSADVVNPKVRTDEERQELLKFVNRLRSDNETN